MTNALPQAGNGCQGRTVWGKEKLLSIRSASPPRERHREGQSAESSEGRGINDLYQDDAPRERCLAHTAPVPLPTRVISKREKPRCRASSKRTVENDGSRNSVTRLHLNEQGEFFVRVTSQLNVILYNSSNDTLTIFVQRVRTPIECVTNPHSYLLSTPVLEKFTRSAPSGNAVAL